MGSHTDDRDNGGETHLNAWEDDMFDPAQYPEQSNREQDDESFQSIANDENTLSPASKKLLEKCAVSMPPPPNNLPMKTGPSVIARPAGTELDFAGFSFAKPTQPTTNFSCRSRAAHSSEAPQMTTSEKNRGVARQRLHGNSNGRPSTSPHQSDTQNKGETSTQPPGASTESPENPPSRPSSTIPTTDLSQEPGTPAPIEDSQRKSPVISTSEKPNMMEHKLEAGPKDHVASNRPPGVGNSPNGKVREEPPKGNKTNETTSRKRKENPEPLNVRSSANQPSKVVKRQSKAKGKSPQSARENGLSVQEISSQPSEEDLFYLLIHRLRQREDSEAASVALREQMETQIHEMTKANEDLQTQLEQAHHKSLNQDAEIGSHRGLIDRWKVKFGKLRAFITGMGNDYECLRREGQAIKSAQQTLTGERQVINDSLKYLHETTGRVEQQCGKHQAQFAEICHDLGSLQQSLALAQGKVTDGKKLLLQEKRRVSMLENFIKDRSTRQQSQTILIQKQQAETSNKLDTFFGHIQKCWDDSHSALKSEFQPGLGECLKLVRLLCDRDFIKPSDLESVHDNISSISSRLASHITQSTVDVERVLKMQMNNSSQLKSEFEKVEDVLNTSASNTENLVRTRELNGRLEEKLRTAEEALSRATTDCSRYMATEKDLQKTVSELEAELTTARQQLMKPPVDSVRAKEEHERVSQLQTQLEETSITLTEAREMLKSKEDEICELRQSLSDTTSSLEDTMRRTAELESEKAELQEQVRIVEQRVREELSRASLTSRDQNRALFEQQVHKLKQEKAVAENSATRYQEQLATAQESLDRAEQSKSAFDEQGTKIITLSARIKELEEISVTSSKMETEIQSLRELQTSNHADRMRLEQQFEAAQSENERFRAEICELQKIQAAQESPDILQGKISFLEDQFSTKENEFAELKGSFETASCKAEMVSALGHSIEEKNEENATLKKQVEETNKRCSEATDNCQKMTDDSAKLRKELSSLEHNKADLAVVQTKLDHTEQESSALRARVQEMEYWSRRVEDFLHKSKILDTKESVVENWALLEARLGDIFHNRPYQTEINSDHQGVLSKETPKRLKQKTVKSSRTATPSNFSESKERKGFVRECHTQEMVYLGHNRQESVPASPRKLPPNKQGRESSREPRPCSSFSIKPFSQVRSDVLTQAPSSSPVSLSDLSGMFPSTPCRDTACSGSQVSRPRISEAPQPLKSRRDSTGVVTTKTSANAGKQRKNSNEDMVEGTTDQNIRRKDKRGPNNNSHGHTPPGLKRKASNHGISDELENAHLRESASSRPLNFHGVGGLTRSKPRNPEYTRPTKQQAKNAPSTPNQKAGRNPAPKGILKDTTSEAIDRQTQEFRILSTPVDGKGEKAKTLRKSSSKQRLGTTPGYFGHASSPKSSVTGEGGVVGVNQSSTQAITYGSREKRRRSSRGNRYNDRFSQGVTWAE